MTISTNELYGKHKKTAKDKALQLSIEELTDIYQNIPLSYEIYMHYSTLKRQLYHNYTVLPQIFVGAITGLGASIIVNEAINRPIFACFLAIPIVLYAAFASRAIFKSHILILKEYEISLIENKICSITSLKKEECVPKQHNHY